MNPVIIMGGFAPRKEILPPSVEFHVRRGLSSFTKRVILANTQQAKSIRAALVQLSHCIELVPFRLDPTMRPQPSG